MMANRWKMAKAFGRAVANKSEKSNAKQIVENVRQNKPFAIDGKPVPPEAKAYDEGYQQGLRDRFDAEDIADPNAKSTKGVDEMVDMASDADTDAALIKDFENALDEAAENHGYKKWREESKDMPLDDGFKGDLHDANREDAVQRSREEIIKALQNNTDRDVTDILRDFGYIFEE